MNYCSLCDELIAMSYDDNTNENFVGFWFAREAGVLYFSGH
jgi:hypothetical protein